ncbi:uncharacterized protein LOC108628456 [Ceratina calcarata]|uniref:Uncharacterized protein LOC108628456 n=1 Tax=Ceratina calcarata TaxID=156304 RepID=A0AAJ7J6G4_9HYME|nr:uncharacterized protein LOC108628456 [Ceratina calcarata]
MTSTNKDYAKLKEVGKYFTEETLRTALQTVHGKEAIVLSWECNTRDATGDSYLSTIYKIKVNGTVNGKEVQVSMVVKCLPENLARRKTFRNQEFFSNEIAFYTKVIPEFEKFVKEKNQVQALCIPRCLVAFENGENDFIALEDVSLLGYKSVPRQANLDYNQFLILVKGLARFQAISFAFKDQHKQKFEEIVESLRETYYSPAHWNWYRRFNEMILSIAKNAVAVEYPGSKAEKKINSYQASDLYKKATEICARKHHPTSVVVQGDAWVPNFMTRKSPEHEALILDFQLARCASPVVDLSTLIYVGSNKSIFHDKFDDLLKAYHNELCKTISLLGSNPESLYPWNVFMDEVKEQFVYGMIFSLEVIPMSVLDDDETFNLDLIKDDNAVDIADVWTLSNIKSQSGRLRSANIIVHAVEKGFL